MQKIILGMSFEDVLETYSDMITRICTYVIVMMQKIVIKMFL